MRINLNDTDKISTALAAVNGRAVVHTLKSCDVAALAERVEKDLRGRGVPKKALKGARVTYSPAGPGKSYARKARCVVSTWVEIERGANDWFLTEADRNEIWADSPERLTMHVTVEARQAIAACAFLNIAE